MKKKVSLLFVLLWLFPIAMSLAADGDTALCTFQGIPWETTQKDIVEVFEKNSGISLEDGGGSIFTLLPGTGTDFFGEDALVYVVAEDSLSSIHFDFEEWYPMPEEEKTFQVPALTHLKSVLDQLTQAHGEPVNVYVRWEQTEDEMLWDYAALPLPLGDDALYTFQELVWEEGLVELFISFGNAQLRCELSLEEEALSALYGVDYYADMDLLLNAEEEMAETDPLALLSSPFIY